MFVPFPPDAVRKVLADPARVARCVPGLQQDAASDTALSGRLRLRIGGSTITYRGALRLTERGGAYELSGEGTEVRGSATVTFTLTALPEEAPGGTRLTCTGTVSGAGRLAELDPKTTESAGRRLLDRFGAALTDALREDTAEGTDRTDDAAPDAQAPDTEAPDTTGPDSTTPDTRGGHPHAAGLGDEAGTPLGNGDDLVGTASGSGVESGDLADAALPEGFGAAAENAGGSGEEPPAEAAHARRTMIGRSAEEVDHAPPRGRYAPVPAPEAATGTAALRWAAPAAALAIAGAVVVTRALRRRR
ncbi:hypothetical protein GCM10010218_27610 [Streptomyces mashuensis]|uniref:Carbon monoxide dehydrogenase subunit G n=1 Tax=Streptomyces mashuensis TaxID=33904 RepID=A0A919B471_9ACTN|nr:hypothetical protein GCM10010218_27610 [Streptomyces mashuensis]